jgi:hypothetical protein
MSVAAFLVTLATSGQAQEQRFKAVSVKTADGLTISAQAWGNPTSAPWRFHRSVWTQSRGSA